MSDSEKRTNYLITISVFMLIMLIFLFVLISTVTKIYEIVSDCDPKGFVKIFLFLIPVLFSLPLFLVALTLYETVKGVTLKDRLEFVIFMEIFAGVMILMSVLLVVIFIGVDGAVSKCDPTGLIDTLLAMIMIFFITPLFLAILELFVNYKKIIEGI